ncbi:MAG: hypothetical protein EBY22_11385, partial [Gammaproteobacteria bacterium]|nr:hypothetical protein [Gammaproteobacteria bacterium]
NGNKGHDLLIKTFIYIFQRYPKYKLQVNTAVLVCLLGNIKNRRSSWKMYFDLWIKTFHFGSIFNFILSLRFLKETTLPQKKIQVDLSDILKNADKHTQIHRI